MTWYLWVLWGAAAISMLCWAGVGVMGAMDLYEKYKEDKRENVNYYESLRHYKDLNEELKRALKETRKGANEFGRISP